MTELPKSWVECRLSDIAEVNPSLDRCPYPQDGTVHFVPMGAVEAESGHIDVSTQRPYSEVRKGYTAFVPGDVLFAKITPCMENGKMAVVPDLPNLVGCGSTEFHVLRAKDEISPDFIYYFVSSKSFRFEAEHKMTGAVGQKRVPTSFVAEHTFPLPPIPEQHRIVARIEELFSELDASVESLTKARALLGLYRQSLLKAAFHGKLTADWRAANPDKLETPETLLSRIRKEREARYAKALEEWQTALSEWRNKGDTGRKPPKPSRFKDLEPKVVMFRQDGWLSLPLDYAIGEMQQGWSPSCDNYAVVPDGAWAIVTTTAVQHRRYQDGEFKLLPSSLAARPELEIRPGDFLMTRKGPRTRTGVVCLVSKTRPHVMLCDTVYRFRCDDDLISPALLEYFLNSPEALRELDNLKAGISDSGISLNHGKVRSVGLRFPGTKEEQMVIIERLETILSQVDKQESEISIAITRIMALRQSILKRAFSGRLVPQDPNDEPASALLARLQTQTTSTPTRRRGRA